MSKRKAPPIFILTVLCALLLMELIILPLLETAGVNAGARWTEENKRLIHMNLLRNACNKENAIWRSALHGPRAQAGHPRILVVGDSFVWGDGYANANDLWWRLLERELHKRGFENAEVCAVGLFGFSMRNEIDAAKKAIKDLNPDIIVWGYLANDADEGLVQQAPLVSRLNSLTKHFRFLFPQLCVYANTKLSGHIDELMSSLTGVPKDYLDWESKLVVGSNFEQFKVTLYQLGDLFTNFNKPAVLVCLPTQPVRGYHETRFQPVKAFLRLLNIEFLDLSNGYLDWFDNEHKRTERAGHPKAGVHLLTITPGNMHPSAALGQYYANSVADYLLACHNKCFEKSIQNSPSERSMTNKIVNPSGVINDCLPPSSIMEFQETEHGYQFKIPKDEHQLFMPLNRPFVQLNLKEPQMVQALELRGKSLASAQVFITTENKILQRDTGTLRDLGRKTAIASGAKRSTNSSRGIPAISWVINFDEPVNTIRISGTEFADPADKRIELVLHIKR
ncbi:MAG: SGNH/GDSL hydrolase family protein [Candidatus Obscuribacterales bacterium]|nr:SGNH/GDSL hydrolase family protein [Candidatus Obscuribacterales bacterium]